MSCLYLCYIPVFNLAQQADLDYMDDNVEKLARRKMKSDAMKRAFAINGKHADLSTVPRQLTSYHRLRKDEESTRHVPLLLSR